MQKWITALVLFTALSLSAEEPEPVLVKGLRLAGSHEEMKDESSGVHIHDLTVPGNPEDLEKKLATVALGKPVSEELLQEIKHTIIQYFRDQGHPVVSVTIPEQEITHGVIEVIVHEARVGKVVCKGNRWFSSDLLQSYLDINPGEVITNDTLLTDVTWMNRNPFRKTDLYLTPGEESGTTDIELITRDRFPVRFFLGGDNTGNDSTGNERWYTGFNWGNAFWCDQQLTFQYTTSSDFHRFQAYTLNYSAPLPWRHILLLFGGYGRVHPHLKAGDTDFSILKSEGHSAQASGRYEIPLGTLYNSSLKEVLLGFDFKNTNNNLEFIGDETIPIITKTVNIGQFVAGFNWGKETTHHKFSAALETYFSPGKMLPHQSHEDFENLRPGAKTRYVYGLLTVGDVYRFPINFSISALLRLQLSSTALLPSEQFPIGGYNTVRGYDERIVNADNALVTNFEIRTFPFHLFKKIGDELYVIGFVDYGLGHNHKPVLGVGKKTEYLLGAGPGLRYLINPYLTFRLDWGFQLHKTSFDDPEMSKVHFGLMASY